MAATAGYSGTPLGRKLGLEPGMRVRLLLEPGEDAGSAYWGRFGPEVDSGAFHLLASEDPREADFVHLFARTLADLRDGIAQGRGGMAINGMMWISWPKKSSSLESEIGRAEVMREGQAAGLVDVKVCAVDADWSGLKFVVPVADRG